MTTLFISRLFLNARRVSSRSSALSSTRSITWPPSIIIDLLADLGQFLSDDRSRSASVARGASPSKSCPSLVLGVIGSPPSPPEEETSRDPPPLEAESESAGELC